MIHLNVKKLIIASHQSKFHRYTNESFHEAKHIYRYLEKNIGCTYLIYMHENLLTNEKYIYSSNWRWQNLLIGEKLINHCPIFLAAFNYLENRRKGSIFLPWYLSPPSTKRRT